MLLQSGITDLVDLVFHVLWCKANRQTGKSMLESRLRLVLDVTEKI
jgi:hypothetical protein